MVELPQVSRRLVTVEAPTQRATKGEGKQILGRAMQQFGAAVSSFADNLQQSTDMAAAAKTEDAWERANVEALEKYKNDPEGYDQWATGFREQLVSQMPGKVGERVGAGLQRAQTRTWAGLTRARTESLTRENTATVSKRLETEVDALVALANGGDTESPEFVERFNKVKQTRDEMAKNPTFVYSEEMRDIDNERLDSTLKGTAIVARVRGAAERDIGEAERLLETVRTDEKLSLKPAQREQFYRAGKAAIREVETKTKADWKEGDVELREVLPGIREGKVRPEDVEGLRGRLLDTGNFRALVRLDQALSIGQNAKEISSTLPPREWRNALSGRQRVTAYTPMGIPDAMEGGYAASRPGPDGKAEVRTLEDFEAGRSPYITLAGSPEFYGREYTIPSITFRGSDGKTRTLQNVRAVVHDTGSAFKGQPEGRFDIPVARDMGSSKVAGQPFEAPNGVTFLAEGDEVEDAPPPVSERTIGGYVSAQGRPYKVGGHVDMNIKPAAASVLDKVAASNPDVTLNVISGYRSPGRNAAVGGATGSRHMHGDAVDVDLKGMTPEQKQKVVRDILAQPGVGGFGYYPKSDTIHFDMREGGRVAWGQNRRSSSVGQDWPEWMTAAVGDWRGQAPGQPRMVEVGAENRMRPAVAAGVEERLTKEAKERLGAVLPDVINQAKRGRLSSDSPELLDTAALVGFAGTEAQKENLAQALTEGEEVRRGLAGDATERQQILDEWRQKIDAGGTAKEWEIRDNLTQTFTKLDESLKKQPYETYDDRLKPGQARTAPFPPLDPTNAAMFKAGLAQRMRTQAEIREWGDMGPFSALAAKDKPLVEEALRSGGAEVVGPVLREIATLEPEVARATLKDLKETVVNLTRTTDPNVYNATFQALDAYVNKTGIDGLNDVFGSGSEVIRDYQTWRGRYQWMRDPEEMKKALIADRDPALAEVRKKRSEDADRESAKIQPGTVLEVFDTFGPSSPAEPMESSGGIATDRLMLQWRGIYAERRMDGMTPDQATKDANERIKLQWGTTEVGGWRIMERPPETQPGYKGVLDPGDMAKALQADVNEWVRANRPAFADRGMLSSSDLPYTLIPNADTEKDIAAGRPPSYWVLVHLPNGRSDIVTKPDGSPLPYSWRDKLAERAKDIEAGVDTARRRRQQFMDQDAVGRRIQEEQLQRRQVPLPSMEQPTTGGGF
jgi:hypothetical protein